MKQEFIKEYCQKLAIVLYGCSHIRIGERWPFAGFLVDD